MHDSQLRLTEIRSLSEITDYRDTWNDLVEQSAQATPFQLFEWNIGIAKFEAERTNLRVVIAENNKGRAVGIAPFWVRHAFVTGPRVLEFIGTGRSDYLDILCLDPYIDRFSHALFDWIRQNGEWSIADLNSITAQRADAICKHAQFDVQEFDVCPVARLPDKIDAYEQRLPKRLRQKLRSKRKKLSAEGRLKLSVARTPEELEDVLPTFIELHQKRQRAKGERGRFFDNHWNDAFKEITLQLASSEIVRLGLAEIDGVPAAAMYNLRLHNREYYYLGGMEPGQGAHSPGNLLHHWMIEQAIGDGVSVYDFGRGDEAYKYMWTDSEIGLSQLTWAASKMTRTRWLLGRALVTRLYGNKFLKRAYLRLCD